MTVKCRLVIKVLSLFSILISIAASHMQRRRKEVWDGGGGKTTGDLGDGSPQRGSRGGTPVGGLGTKSPRSWRIFKVVTSKFYAFLVVFHTFSPIYAYVFFRVCRHHSTKSATWGAGGIWYRSPPLSASGGNYLLCPRLRRLWWHVDRRAGERTESCRAEAHWNRPICHLTYWSRCYG